MERHALGVAAHRDALLGAGQLLKRGLLVYWPPGIRKTHTTRYLVGQVDGYARGLTLPYVARDGRVSDGRQPVCVSR